MRRLIPAVLVLAIALGGCKRAQPRVDTIEDDNRPPKARLEMQDPQSEVQLLAGFYNLEQNSWRWTKGSFSAVLGSPTGAAEKGARLEVKFALPDSVISRRKSVAFMASIEGHALAPETYTTVGDHTYVRDVPASVFAGRVVKADFSMDKYLAAGEVEARELGLVLKGIGLDSK